MSTIYRLAGGDEDSSPACLFPSVEIFSALNGRKICTHSGCQSSGDPVARKLYQDVKNIFTFFLEELGICGIDGHGEVARLGIDWDKDNAAWICRNGVGRSCVWKFNNAYALYRAVVAHEYMHGVTSRFTTLNQSTPLQGRRNFEGALDESNSDVVAIAFKSWDADLRGIESDWKIGNLRDLSQIKYYREFKNGNYTHDDNDDYGNVHDNSEIVSSAFYLAVTWLGQTPYGNLFKVWFTAILKSGEGETFRSFAEKTVMAARTLESSSEQKKTAVVLMSAWQFIGVLRQDVPLPMPRGRLELENRRTSPRDGVLVRRQSHLSSREHSRAY